MAVSANRLELLQIADAVAREKSISRDIVLSSMEDALQKAARSRYGQETEVRAEINPKTGEIRFSRLLLVVDQIENDATQILLVDARKKNPAAQVGDWIAETLPPFDFGRIPAQSAKQVIVQKVREAARDRQYQEYKERIGDIVNGVVKRVEYGNVIIDLGRGEAIVRRDELIPREMFRPGDRIRAYVYDVRREQRGPQIFLSRTHPQFMGKLFAQEVPEIYDGIIEVKSVARDPGSRAKIAVISRDSSIDPVGACVGMRGSRVQAVVNELQGEKIDIIPWSPDAATFIVNALQPAEVVKVVLDEDSARIEVVVPDDQLSLAIGRRGQNVRLASQLTGWDIDILTEAEESERRQKEFLERTNTFMNALDVDEVVGQLLASEGFRSVEELAFVEPAEVAAIEGFDEDTAAEIQSRAQAYLAKIEAEHDERRKELGVADELREIDGVTSLMLVKLGENDVKTVEDLAGCATDDLTGWSERKDGETIKHAGFLDGLDVSRDEAETLIMAARVKAGWIEAAPPAATNDEPTDEEQP
jgi:N utilization substance protein A